MNKIFKLSLKTIFLSIFSLTSYFLSAQTIKYITPSGSGSKDGSSWSNAYPGTSLQIAVNSLATVTGGGQVWVAYGTYTPTMDSSGNASPTDQSTRTFTMKKNVKIYGGFFGIETSLSNRSTSTTQFSILNGGRYHIVTYNRVADTTALLDGFTITGGNASTSGYGRDIGGGIYAVGGVFANCTICNNWASYKAAGAYIDGGIIKNCLIYSNTVGSSGNAGGGGLYLTSYSSPYLASNCTIYSNTAPSGAGVFIDGKTTGYLQNCSIFNNYTNGTGSCSIGGANAGGAGIYIFGKVIISSCAVFNNTSSFMAGGIFENYNGVKIINCTIANNKTLRSGENVNQQIFLYANTLEACSIYNSVITSVTSTGDDVIRTLTYAKSISLNNSLANGYNLSSFADLGFVKGSSYIGYNQTDMNSSFLDLKSLDWNMNSNTSPLFNAGDNSVLTKDLMQYDAAKNPRIGLGVVDIGAFEYNTRRYVTQTGSGAKDGSSWANAYAGTSLQTALNKGFGEVFVAAGTYSPTNNQTGISSSDKSAIYTIPKDVMLYGGFHGDEVNSFDRIRFDKNGDGKIQPWEFKDSTIISGTSGTTQRYFTGLVRFGEDNDTARIDGFILKNALNQAINVESIYSHNKILNCIVTNNGTAGYNLPIIHLRGNSYMFGTYVTQSLNVDAVYNDETPLIDSCLITYSNTFSVGGAGATIKNSIIHHSPRCSWISGTFTYDNCVISEISSSPAIRSTGLGYMYNTILENCSDVGIYADNGFTLVNSTITNTTTGITVVSGEFKIINSTFAQNTTDINCPTSVGNVSHLTNSILTDGYTIGTNTIVKNCAIKGGYVLGDSIVNLSSYTDAKFIMPTTFSGYSTNTYKISDIHAANWSLLPISSLIDNGTTLNDNLVDINNNPRPSLGRYDIGAYEVQTIAPPMVVPTVAIVDATPIVPGNATISWYNSTADGYAVFVKDGATGVPSISDGVDYTASTIFTNGSTPDNSWYCVYNGTGTTVNVSNLTAGNWHSIVVLPYIGKNYKIYAKYLAEGKNVVRFYEKSPQTITFTTPVEIDGQTSYIPNASTTSNYQLSFISSDSTVALPNGTNIQILKTGTVTITASQAGNAQYFPAQSVAKTIVFGKLPQTISFTMATSATYGDADVALVATVTSGLPVIYSSSNTSVATVVNGVLSFVKVGTTTITANQNGNNYFTSATPISYVLTVLPKSQTITFDPLASKTYGSSSFALTAIASSGLPVSYTSSNTAIASVAGNIVTINAAGTATITASQSGNVNYSVATSVAQSLTINKALQILSFTLPTIATYGDADITLNASTTSNLPVIYTSDNLNVATISNGILSIKGAGSATITASVASNANYSDASPISYTLSVSPKAQTIIFSSLTSKTYGDASFALSASASSGLAVTYSSSNPSVASIAGNIVTIKASGTATITASQAGNGNYSVATEVDQVLTVGKASQILTFTLPTIATYGDADITLNASTTSNLPVIYTSDNLNVATISNGILSIKGAGSATITASVASNANYSDASPISYTLSVSPKAQTISFSSLTSKTYGDASFALSASASSGLAVTYSSSNPSVASIAGNIVTIKASGTATITASQAGNGNYSVATEVDQVLTVGKDSQILTFTLPTIATYGDADITLNASTTSNLPVIYTSDNLNVATISNGILSIKGAGSATITASVASNANYSDASPISYTLSVSPKAQTISFGTLGSKTYGDASFALSASASSGLAVTYSSSNPSVASIAGNIVTIKASGTATITASQAGNGNYSVATEVDQVLTVGKDSQILTFTLPTIATYGDADITLNASTTSNLPVIYTSDNLNVATISNGILSIKGAGSATITASIASNANYSDASPISYTLIVSPKAQTISFSSLTSKTYGDASFALSASASSGLAVTYSSSNPSVASIAGNIVTIKASGTATITASQIGNGNYSVATDVKQVLIVGKDSQILSFTLPTIATYGDADITLNALTTSNLPVIYTSDNLNVATISNGILSIKGAGSATITASVASNANYSDASPISYTLSVSPKAQSISMDSIATVIYGSSDIVPIVKTESNGEVSFLTNNSAVASIINGNIHINGVGSAIITATQNGAKNYLPISTTRLLKVVKSSQIISFTAPSIKTFVDSSFVLDGVSSSGLVLSYTSDNPAVATISGDTVNIIGAGKAIITAKQSGDSLYLAANSVSRQLSVLKSDQIISFDVLPQVVFGSIDTIKPIVSSSSLLPISLQSSNYSVAKIENGKIVIVGAGEANITASQSGNSNFNQAAQVQLILTVFAKAQTLSVSKIDTLIFGTKDTVLKANASSGLPLIFSSSNGSVIQIIGSKLHIVHSGVAQITISQVGTKGIAPIDTTITIFVKKAKQTISFANIINKTYGDADFSPIVSASSGLPIELASSNTSIVQLSNGTIHIVGTGTVSITASQVGNDDFEVATPVSQSFTIQKVSQSIIFNSLPTIVYGQKQLLIDANSSSGLPVTFESSNPAIVSIKGTVATILNTGSVIITAKQSGDSNIMVATNKIQTLNIIKRSQTINFTTNDSVAYQKGQALVVNVASSEGLPISFLSSNQSVIAIQKGKPVIVGAGSIILTALQAGNDTIAAASQIEQSVTVLSKVQHITSGTIISQNITYSLVDTSLNITTTEGLSISLKSETPNVIQIVNNKIQTVGTGIATLHLVQAGTAGIEPLDTVIYIKVNKAIQTIKFDAIPTKKLGMIPFKLFATSSSGLQISYSSNNSIVAEVVENEVTINAPGISTITASVPESENYLAASISQPLVVTALNTLKMPLYTISRDTTVDLSSLVLNNDSFSFSFVKANHILASVHNTLATISLSSKDKAWIGTDTLWFKATNTANLSDIQMLGIKVRRIPLTEEIGFVTVDSTTATNTIIAWERSVNAGIKGYIIYRGGNSKDVWDSIAYVPATEKSYFVDKNVNVNKQAYQYSMVTVDSNNLRSNRSSTHTTMHLMTGVNLQNKPQLWWSPYVGADVESYIIYRMNQTTGKLDSIGSSILTSYTDIDAGTGSKDYRVGIRFSKEINPDHLKSDSGPYSVSLSNMAESELVDAPITTLEAQVKAYPNPSSGKFTLEIDGNETHEYSVQVINTLGEVVIETNLGSFSNNKVSIDASSLSQNVYQIKVICDEKVIIIPFVISE